MSILFKTICVMLNNREDSSKLITESHDYANFFELNIPKPNLICGETFFIQKNATVFKVAKFGLNMHLFHR